MQQKTRSDFFLFFTENKAWSFLSVYKRGFTWNVKLYFPGRIGKIFQNAVCILFQDIKRQFNTPTIFKYKTYNKTRVTSEDSDQPAVYILFQDIKRQFNTPTIFKYKTYNKTRVTSEDSDQPAHSRSLISLHWSHEPSTASGLPKQGWTRTLATLTGLMYGLIWGFVGHTGSL